MSKLKNTFVLLQSRLRRLLLIFLFVVLMLACNRTGFNQIQLSTPELKPISCRLLQYALKETCIPLNPNRIAVLDHHQILPTLLALGIKPVGAMMLSDRSETPFLKDKTAGIKNLGDFSMTPNLEKLLALHPDLILGWSFFASSEKLLSQIAPTVLFSFAEAASDWRQFLKVIAAEFDKMEVASKLLSDYELRVQELRKIIESKQQKLRVSCISIYYGIPYLVTNEAPFTPIFKNIGLQRSSLEDAVEDSYFALSQEKIPDIDADIIFLAASSSKEDQDLAVKLQEKPLWRQLKAVQQSRVYQVDADTWTSFNIISANGILDDLYKYLVNAP